MEKVVPRRNIKEYAKKKTIAVGDKAIENKSKVNDFLVNLHGWFQKLFAAVRDLKLF